MTAAAALEQAPDVRARFAKLKQRPVILEVRDLSKSFTAPGRPTTKALDRVSFQVHKRELTCVIGPSGCLGGPSNNRSKARVVMRSPPR